MCVFRKEGEGESVPSQDQLLSILVSEIELSDDYLRELELMMTQCLIRTNANSLDQIRGFQQQTELDPKGIAWLVTSSLIQVHYFQAKKIQEAESEEESKVIDKEMAKRIYKGIETILATWFAAVTKILVSNQLEAVKQAIAADEADFSTKSNSVLTAS